MNPPRILVVRLGAMGDIIHTLPAVASLKHSLAHSRICWIVEPKWQPLLAGNPYVDEIIPFDRRTLAGIRAGWRALRAQRFDFAVDFQGLIKSALIATAARPERIFGFHQSEARESQAAWFYSNKTRTHSAHIVDRNLDLAGAAGAASVLRTFPLPVGSSEGRLPAQPYVLACPLAGWGGKQWPLENYSRLGELLLRETGLMLVLNGPTEIAVPHTHAHASSLDGLIHATRGAAAVVGLDSGPLHLAAALQKPGVALFGPTDPARNGPYAAPITVLRSADAVTTYKRRDQTDASLRDITPEAVLAALKLRLVRAHAGASSNP